jgi:hypothetical protein
MEGSSDETVIEKKPRVEKIHLGKGCSPSANVATHDHCKVVKPITVSLRMYTSPEFDTLELILKRLHCALADVFDASDAG